MNRKCWEIYVPTMTNPTQDSPSKPIKTKRHRVWDKKVMGISSGLTILEPVKGKWLNPNKQLFAERMIPVRIIASEDEIKSIIALTMEFYEQEAVLCYMISDTVLLVYKSQLN